MGFAAGHGTLHVLVFVQSQGQKEKAQEVYEGLLQLEGIDPTLVSGCVCLCVCLCVRVSPCLKVTALRVYVVCTCCPLYGHFPAPD